MLSIVVSSHRPKPESEMISLKDKPLAGKKGLVLGIANEHSLAYGCAEAFRAMGAELAITYGREKTKTYVRAARQGTGSRDFPAL